MLDALSGLDRDIPCSCRPWPVELFFEYLLSLSQFVRVLLVIAILVSLRCLRAVTLV